MKFSEASDGLSGEGESDCTEMRNLFFPSMKQVVEGWYDAAVLLSWLVEASKLQENHFGRLKLRLPYVGQNCRT